MKRRFQGNERRFTTESMSGLLLPKRVLNGCEKNNSDKLVHKILTIGLSRCLEIASFFLPF